MKKLTILLNKKDITNIDFTLSSIAKSIIEGFTSGIDFPVNWKIEKEPTVYVLFETDLHKSKQSRVLLGVFDSFELANEHAKKNDCYRDDCEVLILNTKLNKFNEL